MHIETYLHSCSTLNLSSNNCIMVDELLGSELCTVIAVVHDQQFDVHNKRCLLYSCKRIKHSRVDNVGRVSI